MIQKTLERLARGDNPTPEDIICAKERLIASITGLVVAVGGLILAIVYTEHAWLGTMVALVGANKIDSSIFFPKGKSNGSSDK
jgi:hypothetical protein